MSPSSVSRPSFHLNTISVLSFYSHPILWGILYVWELLPLAAYSIKSFYKPRRWTEILCSVWLLAANTCPLGESGFLVQGIPVDEPPLKALAGWSHSCWQQFKHVLQKETLGLVASRLLGRRRNGRCRALPSIQPLCLHGYLTMCFSSSDFFSVCIFGDCWG